MLKIRRVLLVCALVCLFLVITVIGQNSSAARGRGGTAAATTTVLDKALLTGTIRFQSGGINMYLVVGKEKALLIDTGNPGFISPEEIKALTSLPLLVVNTHAHPDHSGSNNAFGEVYVHEADLQSCKSYSGSDVKLIPIKEGYVFDLGGKKIEVIDVRGHTPGSICLLDAQDKVLFGGDTANTETWAQISNVPLETYKKNLERLQVKYKDKYDRLLPGHNDVLPASYMDELITCADEILTGKVEPTAATSNSQDSLRAGSLTHTYKSAKIRYNPNNLREKNN